MRCTISFVSSVNLLDSSSRFPHAGSLSSAAMPGIPAMHACATAICVGAADNEEKLLPLSEDEEDDSPATGEVGGVAVSIPSSLALLLSVLSVRAV